MARITDLSPKALTLLMVILSVCAGSSLGQTTRKPLSKTAPTAGNVEGDRYKNDSLGLELSSAPGLRFGTPEIKGTPGTVPLLVTIAASNGPDVSSSTETAVFYADDLGYYPETRRSTQAYVDRVVRAQASEGLELVTDATVEHLSGMRFSKAEFRKPGEHEIVLIKACSSYAFVFIFAAADSDGATKLFNQTGVTLDAAKSGCSDDH